MKSTSKYLVDILKQTPKIKDREKGVWQTKELKEKSGMSMERTLDRLRELIAQGVVEVTSCDIVTIVGSKRRAPAFRIKHGAKV